MKNNLKELLEKKNISQKKLAELTKISESAICRYIKGERVPHGANIIKISKALETPTEYIWKI